ncbi:MAG: hypothetical protein M5U34_06940 [Chloroflexi bacterium]|nr:hypothetical protein [Chloroflexota bacterium]
MKQILLTLTLTLLLLTTACDSAPDISAITPPYVDTGIDSEAWAHVPAGEFPYGQHDHDLRRRLRNHDHQCHQ